MNIKYSSERLNKVIRDFCILTNISLAVLDSDMTSLASYSDTEPMYCKEIQKCKSGKEKCICSDLSLLKKCRESMQITRHICHAGILDAAMPIIQNDIIIGYILIGRTRVLSFEEAFAHLDWLSGDREKMKKYYIELAGYNERQVQSLFALISMLVSFILTNDIISTQTDPFAKAVSDFIDEHTGEKISIEMICKEFNVSRNYLYNKFHENFHSTVNDYIIDRKMSKAKELLKNTNLSISLIADKIGMGTYTYFSRLFKDRCGISPLNYRKTK